MTEYLAVGKIPGSLKSTWQ